MRTILPPPAHSDLRERIRASLHDSVDFLVDASRFDYSDRELEKINRALSGIIAITLPYKRDTVPCPAPEAEEMAVVS